MAFGQFKRKIWGRSKVLKTEGRFRIIKKYTFVMHKAYIMMPCA